MKFLRFSIKQEEHRESLRISKTFSINLHFLIPLHVRCRLLELQFFLLFPSYKFFFSLPRYLIITNAKLEVLQVPQTLRKAKWIPWKPGKNVLRKSPPAYPAYQTKTPCLTRSRATKTNPSRALLSLSLVLQPAEAKRTSNTHTHTHGKADLAKITTRLRVDQCLGGA